MKVLTLDQESSMRGKGVDDWAIANGITLHYKAPRQKAWLVERHNEILRQSLHRVESQILKESLVCSFKCVLAIVTFMHNSLIVIHDSSPYNALYGRQPAMLPPLEGGYIREEDHDGRVRRIDATGMHDLDAKYQRHLSRVREIAAATIIEVTALSRLQRADRHKTVAALERSGFQVGGLVDIWYEPTTKDVSGWKGPAQIATINHDEGNVTVRF